MADSCVCLTAYILHRWTLMWLTSKTHKYSVHIKWSVITDKAIVITITFKTVTVVWCDLTVESNEDSTASSFTFNLSENPASNVALFVNECTVKWSEQRTKFLLTRSGTSFKIKFIHSFLMLGSEGRQCKYCFSTTWHCTASCRLWSHLYRLVSVLTCVRLSRYLHYMCKSVGRAKQAAVRIMDLSVCVFAPHVFLVTQFLSPHDCV